MSKIKPFQEPKQQTITISEKDNYSFELVVNVRGLEFIRAKFYIDGILLDGLGEREFKKEVIHRFEIL